MSAGWLLPGLDVSRETAERLDLYEALLRKWNPAINLVARSSLADLRIRHFADSAQIFSIAPDNVRSWLDLGSGGGFPGMVVAILARELRPACRITLVESDLRKAAFLTEVARQTGTTAAVRAERAELLPPVGADIVSARALAPLRDLIGLAERHLAPGGTGLFPKGARHETEVADALETFRFSLQKVPSRTDPQAVVLSVGGISRV